MRQLARFFIPTPFTLPALVEIQGLEFRHLNVLRLQPGDTVGLWDGKGRIWQGQVVKIFAHHATLRVEQDLPVTPEPGVQISLYQGITKGMKWEWIIQKTVELGVARIVPVQTVYSQISSLEQGNKKQRFMQIAQEAARQSQRAWIPEVSPTQHFSLALEDAKKQNSYVLLFDPRATGGFRQVAMGLGKPQRLALLVGPEGGFAPEEITKAEQAEIPCVHLGPRIMRSETAACLAVALALFVFADLGGNP
jgi:16S rRNA (uracil1498-N3)-methyltransferase